MSLRSVVSAALAILVASGGAASARAAEWTSVARYGDPAPGLGSTFTSTGPVAVLEGGGVVFYGRTLANSAGLFDWTEAQGLTLRVSETDLEASFATNPPYFFVPTFLANDSGDVLLRVERTVPHDEPCVDVPLAIAVPAAGEPFLVASVGQSLAGGGGTRTLYGLGWIDLSLSDSGVVAGPVSVVDAPCVPWDLDPSAVRNAFVVSDGAGGLELIAEAGQPVGSDAGGSVYLDGGAAVIDATGAVAFRVALGPPGGPVEGVGLYQRAPGEEPVRLVGPGDPVPGLGPEDRIARTGFLAGNDAGALALPVGLLSDPPDPDRDELLLGGSAASLAPWVREGDPAPIGIDGAVFDTFEYIGGAWDLRFSDAGQLAFVAQVRADGTTREALFVRDAEGNVTAHAVEGPAPAGFDFEWMWFSIEGIGEDGSVLFLARLAGTAIDPSNDLALVLSRPDASPEFLVRTGEMFQLSAGAPEAVEDVFPAEHGGVGTIATSLRAGCCHGALVALRVPEPAGASLAAGVTLALLGAGRRR